MTALSSFQKDLLADLHVTDGLALAYGNKRCAGPALRKRGYITIRKARELDGFGYPTIVTRAYLTAAGRTPASNAHLERAFKRDIQACTMGEPENEVQAALDLSRTRQMAAQHAAANALAAQWTELCNG